MARSKRSRRRHRGPTPPRRIYVTAAGQAIARDPGSLAALPERERELLLLAVETEAELRAAYGDR